VEIGISTATYFGKAVTEDSLALIRQAGAKICEVFLTTFYEYEPDFAKLLAKRKGTLSVHSVHTLNSQFEPELFNPAKRTFEDALALFRKALYAGKILGAKFYTFHGIARIKKREYRFDFQRLGERLSELCRIAAEYGIGLCLENVHWAHYSHPGFFSEVRKYCPDLYTCLDIKQAMQSGADYAKYLGEMGETLRTVHVCDYREDGSLALPGRGSFDFARLFRRLKEGGHADVPVLLELYSGDYGDFGEVTGALEYLREIEKSV